MTKLNIFQKYVKQQGQGYKVKIIGKGIVTMNTHVHVIWKPYLLWPNPI